MNLNLPGEKKVLSFLRTWYVVGILGFSLPFTFPWFRFLTPLSLLLLAGLYIAYQQPRDRRFFLVLILIFLAGYAVEVAGVRTGQIFGVYRYGPTLGPKLAGVPLIIGLNWFIMVYGALAIATQFKLGRIYASLISAGIMTASDLVIEKFAILSDMWSWQSGYPPLLNFISWFILSFLFSYLAHSSVAGTTRRVAIHGYVYQLGLFILVLTIHRLFWP